MSQSEKHSMWRKPRHHSEVENPHDHVHWIELFYDLIQVVTIFMLGNYLSQNMTLEGFAIFIVLFTAIWFAWADSSVFNSIYVSTDGWHRVLMALQIVTTMFIAASIATINTSTGQSMFALAYAVNRAITAILYFRVIRHGAERTSLAWEMARNFTIQSFFFAICAFLPTPYNIFLFLLVMLAIQLNYLVPKIGILRHERVIPRLGHLSERFALLMLIVLGEGFFKLVLTLSEKMTEFGVGYIHYDTFFNFSFGGLSIFVLCWIYFDLVGNVKVKDSRSHTFAKYCLLHLAIMTAGVMIGVALSGMVKVGFFDSYSGKYSSLGIIGLVAYLLSLGLLQQLTEKKAADRFARWDIKIFGVILLGATWFALPCVPSIVATAMWGSALIIQLIVPVYRAYSVRSGDKRSG